MLPVAVANGKRTPPDANAHDEDKEVGIEHRRGRNYLLEIGLRGVYSYGAVNESERWGWRRGMKKQGLAAERFGIHRTTTNGRFVKRDERVGFITRN